jgi:hypothetical protein
MRIQTSFLLTVFRVCLSPAAILEALEIDLVWETPQRARERSVPPLSNFDFIPGPVEIEPRAALPDLSAVP